MLQIFHEKKTEIAKKRQKTPTKHPNITAKTVIHK